MRQADRLARILRVLQLLQSRGRYDAKGIARELEVAERTVYRDLVVLELAGVPWSFDREARCYQLRPDYRFPTLDLTDEELLGQSTATVITAAAGLDIDLGAKPTTEKLAATKVTSERLLREARQLIEVLDLKLVDHRAARETIRTVQWALVERRQLTGLYRSPYEAKRVKLTLHPYRLALVKQAWYLIARADKDSDPRTYRIVRFRSLRMTEATAGIPAEFDLTKYLGNAWGLYRGDRSYKIELRFDADIANVVVETKWHHTQKAKKHPDGTVSLVFTVDGLNEIVRWVVGYAGQVRVVEPKELRELVIGRHEAALKRNR